MTSTNVTEPGRPNGHVKHAHDKTPAEVQLEIERTKSAISDDLRVLSERFSPQQIREGAREVMRDARVEANLLIKEAKQATIGSLIDAKDRAVESVKESVSEKVNLLGDQAKLLGNQAKHASDLTVSFLSKNALTVSLLGFGTGWLLIALRNYRRSTRDELSYRSDYYSLPPDAEPRRSLAREAVRSVATQATRTADRAREEVHSAVHDTRALSQRTRDAARRAAREAQATASNNRVAVVALTVAAGLGLSLLLPVGRRPRRALLGAGERVWDGAQTRARQLAERAREVL
jgi:ElaB/YqjD/DUF883 family membrane-anchored ribosome-binding protein